LATSPRKYTSDEAFNSEMNWFISAGSTRRTPCGTTTNRIDDG